MMKQRLNCLLTMAATVAFTAILSACVMPPPVYVAPAASAPPVAYASAPATTTTTTTTTSYLTPHLGQTAVFTGTYAGWASCDTSTAHTRSDWVVQYVEQNGAQGNIARCVYVTGGLPQGIAPAPSTLSIGMPVVFKAIVKQGSGKPYLQLIAP